MKESGNSFWWLLLISSFVFSESPSDNFSFSSAIVSFHKRISYVDFGYNKKESVEHPPLYTVGILLGRNYRIPAGLRVRFPLLIEYGYVKEEETHLWLEGEIEKQAVGLRSILFNVGTLPSLQYPFRLSLGTWGVVGIGGGIFYTNLKEEEYKISNPKVTIIGDDYVEESKGIVFAVSANSGLEFLISPTMSIELQYLLRFYGPLSRGTSRDLFPLEKKKYTDFFLTHSINLSVLVFKVW